MLKVLILSHMFPRESHKVGGIFVMEQVQALRQIGIDARVVSGDPFWVNKFRPQGAVWYARAWRYSKLRWRWTDCNGVPVVFFPYLAGGIFRPCVHAWTYEIGLRSILEDVRKEFNYDLVHAHTSYLDGNAGVLAARLNSVPLVITEHTGPFSLLTNHVLKRYVTRRAVQKADSVISVGESLRSDMRNNLRLQDTPITILPNGYNHHIFNARGRVARRSNDIKALWVGHFVPVKRIDRLVEAFATVAGDIPELTISLIGDGEGLGEAKQDVMNRGLADRVHFLDKMDREGVAAAMSAHDFLIVSSEVETFSLVTIEAFASGLPVLSTRCGGPEGLITDPSLGRLVANNVDGLAAGLVDVCRNINNFDPAFIAAHVASKYSWAAVARELTMVYQKLIEGSIYNGSYSTNK